MARKSSGGLRSSPEKENKNKNSPLLLLSLSFLRPTPTTSTTTNRPRLRPHRHGPLRGLRPRLRRRRRGLERRRGRRPSPLGGRRALQGQVLVPQGLDKGGGRGTRDLEEVEPGSVVVLLLLLVLQLPSLVLVSPRPRLPLLPGRGRRASRAGRVRPRGRAVVARGLRMRLSRITRRRNGSVDKGEGVWLLLLLGKLWRRRLNERVFCFLNFVVVAA